MEFPEWVFNDALMLGLGIFSVITFIGSLILVPVLVCYLPEDYFLREKRRKFLEGRNGVIRGIAVVIKNFLGLLLIIAGILMLFLPGQGVLTILLGIAFLDVPGKYYFERNMIRRKLVYTPLNWIRKKGGKSAFTLP